MQEILIICLVVISVIIVGLLGYIAGKINTNTNVAPQSFFKKNTNDTSYNNVSIDEKKIVTTINTKGLEKKYDSLGDTKTSEENISSSINKLKTLKS